MIFWRTRRGSMKPWTTTVRWCCCRLSGRGREPHETFLCAVYSTGTPLKAPRRKKKSGRKAVSAATRAARQKNKQKMFIQKVKNGHKQIDQLLAKATPSAASPEMWTSTRSASSRRGGDDMWAAIPDDRAIPTSKHQQDINLLMMQVWRCPIFEQLAGSAPGPSITLSRCFAVRRLGPH